MNSGIYVIRNTRNGKEYVGSSKRLLGRKTEHFRNLSRNKHPNFHLQASYNLYGVDAFIFEIVEYCTTDILTEREDWWISLINCLSPNGYNLLSADRKEMSEATKNRISISCTGRTAHNKGKSHTEEHKAKISSSMKGKVRSIEVRNKISSAMKGVIHCEEARKKMSVSRRKWIQEKQQEG